MKTKIWYVHLVGNELLVTDDFARYLGGRRWKVRTITYRAAARRLLRGGTIAEEIAKCEFEWNNPFQPQHEDSPANDRKRPYVKKRVKQISIRKINF